MKTMKGAKRNRSRSAPVEKGPHSSVEFAPRKRWLGRLSRSARKRKKAKLPSFVSAFLVRPVLSPSHAQAEVSSFSKDHDRRLPLIRDSVAESRIRSQAVDVNIKAGLYEERAYTTDEVLSPNTDTHRESALSPGIWGMSSSPVACSGGHYDHAVSNASPDTDRVRVEEDDLSTASNRSNLKELETRAPTNGDDLTGMSSPNTTEKGPIDLELSSEGLPTSIELSEFVVSAEDLGSLGERIPTRKGETPTSIDGGLSEEIDIVNKHRSSMKEAPTNENPSSVLEDEESLREVFSGLPQEQDMAYMDAVASAALDENLFEGTDTCHPPTANFAAVSSLLPETSALPSEPGSARSTTGGTLRCADCSRSARRCRRCGLQQRRLMASLRERKRSTQLNTAFDALRSVMGHVPTELKLSKIKILRLAIRYVETLQDLLEEDADELS